MLETFAEAGGNFVDTANAYTNGTAERYLGELLGADRDRFVLATKYTMTRDPSDPNGSGNHRKSLIHALDGSLQRLATEYVDLLWVHIWDFLTPIEEVMRALDDQVRAGKVLYLGISDTPAWIIARANAVAEHHGWTPFVAAQAQYSLIERTVERDLVPMARALDLAITAWSPLGMRVLTGKYADGSPDVQAADGRLHMEREVGARLLSNANLAIARAVREIATELGASPAQVALSWVRSRPGVVIPLVGVRNDGQLRDNLGALDLELGAEHLARLDTVSAIELGFPSQFILEQRNSRAVLGDAANRIDDHRASSSGLPLKTPAASPGREERPK
jgi:aryl-alcohol dehydrogenase-like predicted oxidoreductase